MAQFQTVCHTDDVPEGSGKMFIVNEQPIGVFCVDGQFFALDNRCPHAGASLAHGIIEGDTVACRIHHWRFRVCDGQYLDEAKPEYDARCYRVRVRGEEVQVDISQIAS